MCEESYKEIGEYFNSLGLDFEVRTQAEVRPLVEKLRTLEGALELVPEWSLFKPFRVTVNPNTKDIY